MEEWFYYNRIRKETRLAYAIDQLAGEVYRGWLREKEDRIIYKEPPITTWEQLKKLLRDQYVPKPKDQAFTSMNHPRKNVPTSIDSKEHVNKQTDQGKATRIEEMKEELLDMLKNHPKSPTKRPYEAKATHHEQKCLKENSVVQKTETEQPLLVCKGMNEISTSNQCANEILLSYEVNKPEVSPDLEEAPNKLEEACLSLTNQKPVQPSIVEFSLQVHEENQPEQAQKEQPNCHEPEPIPKSLTYELQKHCKPELFILVYAQEEKRFGLNHVKEFCVSNSVFNNMIQSFENIEFNDFSRQKALKIGEFCESNLVLSYNSFRDILDQELIRVSQRFVFSEPVSMLKQFIIFSNKDLYESVSYRASCIIKCTLNFKYCDMICLSWLKRSNAGFGAALKCQRRTHKREEDKRFKPPDLDQEQHQNVLLLILIKQEPPDDTNKPMPSLNRFQGKYNISHILKIDLLPFLADSSDLRTNPFQEGGDDVILPSTDGQDEHTDSPAIDLMIDPKENPDPYSTDGPTDGPTDVHIKIQDVPKDNQTDGRTHDQDADDPEQYTDDLDGPATNPKEEPPDDPTDSQVCLF